MKPGLGVRPPTPSDEQSSIRSAPPATAALNPKTLSTQTSSKMRGMRISFKAPLISSAVSRASSAKLRRQPLGIRAGENLPALGCGLDRAARGTRLEIGRRDFAGILHFDQEPVAFGRDAGEVATPAQGS